MTNEFLTLGFEKRRIGMERINNKEALDYVMIFLSDNWLERVDLTAPSNTKRIPIVGMINTNWRPFQYLPSKVKKARATTQPQCCYCRRIPLAAILILGSDPILAYGAVILGFH
jgi:hypothetical protein